MCQLTDVNPGLRIAVRIWLKIAQLIQVFQVIRLHGLVLKQPCWLGDPPWLKNPQSQSGHVDTTAAAAALSSVDLSFLGAKWGLSKLSPKCSGFNRTIMINHDKQKTVYTEIEGWSCCHCPIFQCWLAALMRVSLSTLWLFDPDCYSWRTMLGPWKKGWLLSASDTILVARTAPWILQRTVGWSCLQDFHLSPQTQTDDMRWHAFFMDICNVGTSPNWFPRLNAML